MRLALFLLIGCCLSAPLQAQVVPQPAGTGRISGTAVSADDRPLASAAVTIRSAADSSVVTGAIAGADGRFHVVGLPAGRYLVRISLIGYVPTNLPPLALVERGTVDLGTVRLEVQPVRISGVEASVERAPVVLAPDRTVYDARQMPAAEGGSAADVLRHVNELEVDFNGRVSMRGDQAVAVYINGRAAPMKGDQLQEFLKQLPGKAIARVEVIPNPSAKYDPEGMGGIVNLVLRDDASLGLSGSLGTNVNTKGALGANGRIAWQKGRLTLFTGVSGMLSDSRNSSLDLRQRLLPSPGSYYEQRARGVNENVVAFGDFSVEYRLAPDLIVWTNGYASSHAHDRRTTTAIGVYDEPAEFLDHYTRSGSVETPHDFVDIGAGIKRQIVSNRHELTADLRRTVNSARNLSTAIRTESMDPELLGQEIRSHGDELSATWTLRADYVRPWGKQGELGAGVHVSRRDFDEDAFQEMEPAAADAAAIVRDERFRYDESVNAAYLNASRSQARFSLQLGLRAELADTEFSTGEDAGRYRNEYNSIFPSANLSYEIDRARSIRIGYSKRVGRPPTHLLRPTMFSDDPSVRMQGNPLLGPNYTHTANAQFSWSGAHGTLRIMPYYRRTYDQWEQIRALEEDGTMVLRWANTATLRQVGSTFTVSKPANARFGGSLSTALYHNATDASNVSEGLRRSGLRWSAGGTLTFKLQDATVATINTNYMAPRDVPQGRMGGSVMSSLGVRHQLLAGKGTLNLFVNDPLDLHRFRLDARDRTFLQLSRTTPRMRAAQLSFTWNFGKAPKQQSRRETEEPGNP